MLSESENNQRVLATEFDQHARSFPLSNCDKKKKYKKEEKTKELTISLPDPVPLQRGVYVTLSGNTTPSTVNTLGLEEGIDSFRVETDDIGDDISCFGNDDLEDLQYDFDYTTIKSDMRSNKTSFETVVPAISNYECSRSYLDSARISPGEVDFSSCFNNDGKSNNEIPIEWRDLDHTNIPYQAMRSNAQETEVITYDNCKMHSKHNYFQSGKSGTTSNNSNIQRGPAFRTKRQKEEGGSLCLKDNVSSKGRKGMNSQSLPFHLEEIDRIHQYHLSIIHHLERKVDKKEACIEKLKNQIFFEHQTRKREIEEYQNILSQINGMMLDSKRKIFALQKEVDECKKKRMPEED